MKTYNITAKDETGKNIDIRYPTFTGDISFPEALEWAAGYDAIHNNPAIRSIHITDAEIINNPRPTVSALMEINPAIFAGTLSNGMLFSVVAEPEDRDAVDYWHRETDCFDTLEDAEDHAYKSDNPFWWCTIHVTVKDTESGIEEDDYLGACNYENGQAFIGDAYFSDMVYNCISAINQERGVK